LLTQWHAPPSDQVEQATGEDARRSGTRDLDRRLEQPAAVFLLGPHEIRQPGHLPCIRDVERVEVDACAPRDRGASGRERDGASPAKPR
jgi:hypothetical protein